MGSMRAMIVQDAATAATAGSGRTQNGVMRVEKGRGPAVQYGGDRGSAGNRGSMVGSDGESDGVIARKRRHDRGARRDDRGAQSCIRAYCQ